MYLTASFLATGGFIKLFYEIPCFFQDYSVLFLKFHDISMHETFFPDFPDLVGTLCQKYKIGSLFIVSVKSGPRNEHVSV